MWTIQGKGGIFCIMASLKGKRMRILGEKKIIGEDISRLGWVSNVMLLDSIRINLISRADCFQEDWAMSGVLLVMEVKRKARTTFRRRRRAAAAEDRAALRMSTRSREGERASTDLEVVVPGMETNWKTLECLPVDWTESYCALLGII